MSKVPYLSVIYLKQMEVGPMANFVYLVGDAESREVLLVDPAWQIDTILRTAEREDLKITGALVTHGHFDHCNGLDELLAKKDIPVYVNEKEVEFLQSLRESKGSLFGDFPKENTRKVRSGDTVKAGNVEITFIHTPGHTPGSQCFLVRNNLISGDTLFIRGCGRSDLPGGNPEELYKSLTQKLLKLPDDTILYPGHFYTKEARSTMKEEKIKNPYLLSEKLETFLSLVGAGAG